jgi:hypothetical protein
MQTRPPPEQAEPLLLPEEPLRARGQEQAPPLTAQEPRERALSVEE